MKGSYFYPLRRFASCLVLVFFISMTSSTCEFLSMEPDSMVLCTFANQSNRDVCIIISGREYPDTLYPQGYGIGIEVHAQDESEAYISHHLDYWKTREQYLEEFPIIQLFVVDREIARNKRPSTIRAHKLILRRYEISREWLEQHNWRIVYP